MAISHAGQFVAILAGQVIRAFNVQTGDVAGELSAPGLISNLKGMAFSPDGRTLAAIVPGYSSGEAGTASALATLLEWDVANGGKLARSVPIDLTRAALPINQSPTGTSPAIAPDVSYLQWTPDGRMVRVGGGLFEITSGTPIYSFGPQASGNLNGQLISVENRRSTYEFLPVGTSTRLLLKTVDLPGMVIDSSVAVAQASVGKNQAATPGNAGPSTASKVATAPAGSSDAVNAMMISPGAVPPAAPPQATDQLAAQGQWDVLVKAVVQANAADPSARKILAVLPSGVAVHITTDSDAAATFADGVHPGDHIHIVGDGQVSEGKLLVTMQSGAPSGAK